MSHARLDRGIAVISTLLIALVVIGIGIGAITLNRSNVRIASNVQTGAIARLSADSGLEAIVAFLSTYNEAFGTLPADLSDAPTAISVSGTALSFDTPTYTPDAAVDGKIAGATLQVVGTGPNGARFVTDAVIALVEGDGDRTVASSLFRMGLVGDGVVSLDGAGTFVTGGLHGGQGFDVGGSGNLTFQSCTTRDTDGTCSTTTTLASDYPISANSGEASYTCSIGGSPNGPYAGSCATTGNGKNAVSVPTNLVDDPIDAAWTDHGFTSDFEATRERVLCSALNACSGATTYAALTASSCDVSVTGNTNYSPSAPIPSGVVCVAGNVTLDANTDLTDVTLIVEGDVSSSGEVTLLRSTIVTFGATSDIDLETSGVADTRLLGSSSLCVNCNNQDELNVAVTGTSTLATSGSLAFASQASLGGDQASATVAVIAEGDISIKGSNDPWAVFLTGCNFTSLGSGARNVYGGVVADNPLDDASCGNVEFKGSAFVDSGVSIANSDLPQESAGPVEVVSMTRRR